MTTTPDEHDARTGAAAVSAGIGLLLGVIVYVLIAPFRCYTETYGRLTERVCDGIIAFHYSADSTGHWQAIGASAAVAAATALLIWLFIAPEGRSRLVVRVFFGILLLVATPVMLLSHSFLALAAPVSATLGFWLLRSGTRRSGHLDGAEPGPLHSRF